ESRAFGRSCQRAITLDERLEDRVEQLRMDAAAGIAHLNADVGGVDRALHFDAPAVSELDGVREQIENDLFDLRAVDPDGDVGATRLDAILEALLPEPWSDERLQRR